MSLIRKEYPPEYLAMIGQLRLIDDTFFATRLDDNPEGMNEILRPILGRGDITVESSITQRSAQNLYGRGVRFDVLAQDESGKLYNCEVQRNSAGAIPRRARHNGSLLNSRELAKGTKVKDLPETHIIFIAEGDTFHAGMPLYHVDRTIRELHRDFGDGLHIIYVNGENRDDTPLGRLMQDFFQTDPRKFHNKVLAERAAYFKSEERGIASMCEITEQFGAKREELGRREGRREGARETARSLLTMGLPH